MAGKKATGLNKLEKRVEALKVSIREVEGSKGASEKRGLRKKLKRAQRRSKRLNLRAASIAAKARKKGEGTSEKKEGE